MSDERVSIIHQRSNTVSEAVREIATGVAHTTEVRFETPPDCPVRLHDWYWVVVGGTSEQYELRAVTEDPICLRFAR